LSSHPEEFLVGTAAPIKRHDRGNIRVSVSGSDIEVSDNCGGIGLDEVQDAFRIGKTIDSGHSILGVYGIGLKRALFKIGKHFQMHSSTAKNAFSLDLDVALWAKSDSWDIPLALAKRMSRPGTAIKISKLTEETALRTEDRTFHKKLHDFIARSYCLLLGRYVQVSLDGREVLPLDIPLAQSAAIRPARETFQSGDVQVTLIAGLSSRSRGSWNIERAGWYVFCNGRAVLFADKSDLSGWGLVAPQFVSKFRGFVGAAFFFSKNPEALPWTTTKRGLNREALVFQEARNRMAAISRPILTFLNRMYSGEEEELVQRELAEELEPARVSDLAAGTDRAFAVSQSRRTPRTMVSVQYRAKVSEIERAKRRLARPSWSAGTIGRHALEYFLDRECPE
jgi:hypothetical protein